MKQSKGSIRAKGICPICKQKFGEIRGVGYICLEQETVPKRLYVDMPWKGSRIRLFSDKSGQPLDSYSRAEKLLKHLHYEVANHTFDPSRYLKADTKRFYCGNLLEEWIGDKKREAEKGRLAWSYINPLDGYLKMYFKPFFRTSSTSG
jgi:hypothetical protein